MSDSNIRINIDVEGAQAVRGLDDVADAAERADDRVEQLDGRSVDVEATADTSAAGRQLTELEEAAERLERAAIEVEATADTDRATGALDELESAIEDFQRRAVEVEATADTSGAVEALDELGDTIDGFERTTVEVAASADTRAADSALAETAEAADRLDKAQVSIPVTVDDDALRRARSALDEVGDATDQLSGEGGGIRTTSSAFRDMTEAFGGADSQLFGIAESFEGLGDVLEGFGGRLGLSEVAVGRLTTVLGGALGIFGAVGLAITAGKAAWDALTKSQEDNRQVSADLLDIQEALAAGEWTRAVEGLQKTYGGLLVELSQVGVSAEEATRFILGQREAFGEAAAGAGTMSDAYILARRVASEFGIGVDEAFERLGPMTEQLYAARDATAAAGQATEVAAGQQAGIAEALGLTSDAEGDLRSSTEGATEKVRDQTSALEAERDRLRESVDALNAKVEAQRVAADASYAVSEASRDYQDALAGLDAKVAEINEREGDAAVKAREVERAYDEARQSAVALADAEVRRAEETATANGQTLAATAELDTFNRSLLASATSADGPLRDAIVNYIATVNSIPPEQLTSVRAAIDGGDIAAAEVALNETSRQRTATIRADALGVSEVEAELNALERVRIARIQAIADTGLIPANGVFARASGGPIPGSPSEAVPFIGHGGEYVLSEDVVSAIKRGGTSSGLGRNPAVVGGVEAPTVIVMIDGEEFRGMIRTEIRAANQRLGQNVRARYT